MSTANSFTPPFIKNIIPVAGAGEIHQYVGSPSCEAFYKWILNTLLAQLHQGFGPPNPPLSSITTGQMGNLGESIAFLVGHFDRFHTTPYLPVLGGALTPFNPGTVTGLDIIIVYLDPVGKVENDRLFIQEIKTTYASDLDYSKALIGDYEKLLDTTKPSLSLLSRVSALKAKLKWEHRYHADLLLRVEDLAQPTAEKCNRIRLLPTLIHDRSSDPQAALTHVLNEIQKKGWSHECMEAWSISIAQLEKSFLHMANMKAFTP